MGKKTVIGLYYSVGSFLFWKHSNYSSGFCLLVCHAVNPHIMENRK